MKKYLMTGIAALVLCVGFTSCSHDLESLSEDEINELQAKKIVDNYNKAFKAYIGGEVAPNQTWGFGVATLGSRTRGGNTNVEGYVSYPATHEYKDAEGNVIAAANMNHNQWADPNEYYGGWQVPDPLTDGQKLRVQLYFQTHPNLSYEDPQYAHFFVQQVYTGGTSAYTTGNSESTVGADGQAHQGMTLNQLTVGQACSHINDFNAGTCTESDVLDNGQVVNGGTTHKDQITLMLNVDDTSCFGFHETSGSNTSTNNQHNDKMALVDAATIDAWAESAEAKALFSDLGEAVVDKWNRSFMGFDYELLPESDIVTDSYALLSQVPNLNNMQYAWDGEKVMVLGEAPEATEAEEVDITSTFAQNTTGSNVTCSYDSNGNIVCNFTGPYYNNIIFAQNADWTQYDKLVIEFAGPSPINATLTCDGDASISVGDTKVEVATVNYAYTGQGPNISNNGIGTKPGTQTANDPLTLTIKSVKLVKEATAPDASIVYYNPTYLLGDADADKIAFYSTNTNMYGGIVREVNESEMKTSEGYLNLKFFQDLVAEGYHPLSGSALKTWVKWQAACDGYYSDWIVTLTKAKRIGEVDPDSWSIRVMAEDLSATEASDFDFNDVVFDVVYTKGQSTATITLQAAGGTLPLRFNEDDKLEVHALFGVPTTTMVNTNWTGSNGANGKSPVVFTVPFSATDDASFLAGVKAIKIEVKKSFSTGDAEWFEMEAEQGKPAAKFAVPTTVGWVNERVSLKSIYGKFSEWATTAKHIQWWRSDLADDQNEE